MRIVRNVIRRIINWGMREEMYPEPPMPAGLSIGTIATSKNKSQRSIQDHSNSGMNFIVFPAIGGKVIQFSKYNPNTDMHESTLYIITDMDNFGEELGQIIIRESLSG